MKGDFVMDMIKVKDNPPNPNERVLVFRSCMINSDIGPFSVQWGWSCKSRVEDGQYWMSLGELIPDEYKEENNETAE